MDVAVEKRMGNRTEISWPVSIWMPNANRFFNGRSINISKTGVFVKMPMATPINENDIVEMNFPRTLALATEKGGFARIKTGKIVRVDRQSGLKDAYIGVGIAFEQGR